MSPTTGPVVAAVTPAPAAAVPPPPARVGGVTVAIRAELKTAAAALTPVAARPTPELVERLLPKPGKNATNLTEVAARLYADGCYGLDFGESRIRNDHHYSSGTDILTELIVLASRFSTMQHPVNATAIAISLALTRSGVEVRFPGHVELGKTVAVNAITAWIRAAAEAGDLLQSTDINNIVMNAATAPIRAWTRDTIQAVVDASLTSVTTLDDKDRSAIANAIVDDDSGFEYPTDLSPEAIANADLSAQAGRVTQLWTASDQFGAYGNAVYAFLDDAAREVLHTLPSDQTTHLLWLVGREIVNGSVKPNTRDVSNAISQRLETLLDPASNPDGVFAIVAAETGVTVAIPAELPAADAAALKLDLLDTLHDMDWQYGTTVDDHVAHMRNLLEHLNSNIDFVMRKDRLMKAIEAAQVLISQLQVPELAPHIEARDDVNIRLHTSTLGNFSAQVANAADVDGMHVPAVEEAIRAARLFARLLGPQLRERSIAAATATAGGGTTGGNGGQGGNTGGGPTP